MSICKGKLSSGESCTKSAEDGKGYCVWHDPEDQSWLGIYNRLDCASPDERFDIVMMLIRNHPEHILYLPKRCGKIANLSDIDLSIKNLESKCNLTDLKMVSLYEPGWGYVNLAYANLQGANLKGAILKEVSFFLANLQDVHLHGAKLQRAELINTNLQGAHLMMTNLEKARLISANLTDATLGFVNFRGANLSRAVFRGAILGASFLEDADLSEADLQGVICNRSKFQGAKFNKSKLQHVDLSNSEISGIFIADAWLDGTRLNIDQIASGIGEEKNQDYLGAKRGYMHLKQNYEDLGDYDSASWAYRKERRMEKLETKQLVKDAAHEHDWKSAIAFCGLYIGALLQELLCDYGESVGRVISWLAFMLLFIGPLLFSWLGRFDWSNQLLQEHQMMKSPLLQLCYRYVIFLIYTFDTLTTANFSGFQPKNLFLKLASGIFSFIGIFFAGLLGFVVGNRIRHS